MPPYFEKETCEWQMPTLKSDEPYFRCHVNEREHPMKCHDLDYRIIGHDLQVVEVGLDPGETVIAETGAMNYLEDGIA